MRAITITNDADEVLLNVYYDGKYTDDEEEDIDIAVTNIITFLPDSYKVGYRAIRLDEPEPLPEQQYFLYLRKYTVSAESVERIRDYQLSMWRERAGNSVSGAENKALIPVTDQISRQDQILLSAICAMLGELSYNVMGITQNNRETYIFLSFYFETEWSAADLESVENIKNNLSLFLSEGGYIRTGVFLVGPPGRTPVLDTHVYRRQQR